MYGATVAAAAWGEKMHDFLGKEDAHWLPGERGCMGGRTLLCQRMQQIKMAKRQHGPSDNVVKILGPSMNRVTINPKCVGESNRCEL